MAEDVAPSRSRRPLARLWRRLRGGELSRTRASASIAVGLFVGCLPLYGLHLPLCLAICLPLRLDAVTAYIAANVSNPLFAPFLVAAEIQTGSFLLDGQFVDVDLEQVQAIGLTGFAAQLVLGSLVVGALLAGVGASITWLLVGERRAGAPSALDRAMQRTIARYRTAPRSDRYYVAAKLHADPVVEQIVAEPGDFGDLFDVGCGRGQLGLLLFELGRVRSLVGSDADERKVSAARAAAGDGARFEVANAQSQALPEVDTVFVIDVLHYLAPSEQDALLARAAAALRAGGRLYVRELDSAEKLRAFPARLAERIARATGYNRGSALWFTTTARIVETLEALGLACRIDRSGGLSNVLVIGTRALSSA